MRIQLQTAVMRIVGGSLAAVLAFSFNPDAAANQDADAPFGEHEELPVDPDYRIDSEYEEGYETKLDLRGKACGDCSMAAPACRCTPWWAHRTGLWGELLVLRPGSTDLIHAVEQDDAVPGRFPTGPVGIVGVDEELGFRVGFSVARTDCTSLVASYSRWDGDSRSAIEATPGTVLDSQVIHPSTMTAGSTAQASAATQNIAFQLADLGYRHLIRANETTALNWTAGLRYGNLEQQMAAAQTDAVPTGLATVRTDVDFDGFGLMLGLDGERRSCATGMLVYGRGMTSLLAGEWDATYTQVNQFGGGVVANQIEDFRVTPVLELEVGLGWQSKSGRLRATTGWMTSAWYDALSTRSYVEGVRRGDLVDLGETVTFTGLTSRVELRF